jgi:hypothetical protein
MTPPPAKANAMPTVLSKFQVNLYGFVEADFIHDTTQDFLDAVNMGAMKPGGTEIGDNGRTQFGARNSRLGVNVAAPEWNGMKATAQLEMDFLGNQPSNPPATGGTCTVVATTTGTTCVATSSQNLKESTFWNNPAFRMRQAWLKVDNDFITVLFGQTWELIGWQTAFQPNTVEIQGIPGEIYSRTMQLRLSHTFKMPGLTLDIAAAMLRPPQMDSEIPDFQGGVKLAIDGWTGIQTIGATKTGVNPMALGLSGGVRSYKLANNTAASPSYSTVTGSMGAAEIMIPLLPSAHRGDFGITVVAEGSVGTGDADIFTGLTNGAVNSPVPAVANQVPTNVQTYANQGLNNVDPGLAGWTTDPMKPALETVDWQTFIASVQIYPPIFDGNVWVSGTYSNSLSHNIGDFGPHSKLFFNEIFWDVNLFTDLTPAVRLGLEYAHFGQNYTYNTTTNTPGISAQNSRVQFSAFYIF